MKSLIVLFSCHHNNTAKIASVFARVLDAQIMTPQQTDPMGLQEYDLIGFGSGIYSSNVHEDLLDLANKLPQATDGKAFLFSTSGAPAFFDRYGSYRVTYARECHTLLRDKLQFKGYKILGEFSCAGHNTNSFLKLFGGINKGRPNTQDLKNAEEFALNMKQSL
jgi:flavodoxin